MFQQLLESIPRNNRRLAYSMLSLVRYCCPDTIALWKKICANPLLQRATIVLFLNKTDILRRTLESGVRLRDYVPSYGENPNDVRHVTKCMFDL